MEEFSDLNFKHYVNLFTDSGDELSLQDLYLLKERYPNFDFSKYKVGIFTIENIEKFGEEFLIENYVRCSKGSVMFRWSSVILRPDAPIRLGCI